jgi:hypothetical protein
MDILVISVFVIGLTRHHLLSPPFGSEVLTKYPISSSSAYLWGGVKNSHFSRWNSSHTYCIGTSGNPETGFCVLRIKIRGNRDLITLVGSAASIQPGEYVHASGQCDNHRDHGLQFKADFLKVTPPMTTKGIERYLGSGMIKGIGLVYAKKLVGAFGEAVFEVIEQTSDKLCEETRTGGDGQS